MLAPSLPLSDTPSCEGDAISLPGMHARTHGSLCAYVRCPCARLCPRMDECDPPCTSVAEGGHLSVARAAALLPGASAWLAPPHASARRAASFSSPIISYSGSFPIGVSVGRPSCALVASLRPLVSARPPLVAGLPSRLLSLPCQRPVACISRCTLVVLFISALQCEL